MKSTPLVFVQVEDNFVWQFAHSALVPGSIRESGGAFGKREAALEEQYFHNLQNQQIQALKKHHSDEIEFHKKEIARHQALIEPHSGKIEQIPEIPKVKK